MSGKSLQANSMSLELKLRPWRLCYQTTTLVAQNPSEEMNKKLIVCSGTGDFAKREGEELETVLAEDQLLACQEALANKVESILASIRDRLLFLGFWFRRLGTQLYRHSTYSPNYIGYKTERI